MGERQAFRDAIAADEEVERLLERISMVERFHAVLATCEMPRVANALVDILEAELPQQRRESMRFVRLDPYRAHKDILAPIPVDLLIDEILAKVVHPPVENQGSSVMTIVDASRALPQDDDAWSIMFQRMNERRNAIMRALPAPYLIVGPKRYDVLFARAAADFWSILGAIVDVPTPLLDEEWAAIFGNEYRLVDPEPIFTMMMSSIAADEKAIAEAEHTLEQTRQHFARKPDDPTAASLVAMQLLQLGTLLGPRDPSKATMLLTQALGTLQAARIDIDNPIRMSVTRFAFFFRGLLYFRDKQFVRALDDIEQSTQWARSIGVSRYLASNLLMLGILQLQMGNIDAAIKRLSESIQHYHSDLRFIVETRAGASSECAEALYNLGTAYMAKRDLDNALLHYEQAAETSRQALQQNFQTANSSRQLAQALLAASKIQMIRGDHDRAEHLAEQARETLDPTPTGDFFTNALANDIRAHLAQLKAAQ